MYLKNALLYIIIYNIFMMFFFHVFIIMYLKNAGHVLFSHFWSHIYIYIYNYM